MVYAQGRTREAVVNRPTPKADRARFCITDDEVLTLAGYAIAIEDHYSAKAGHWRPMDIEWAKDGLDGELYIVQARPETVASQRKGTVLESYTLKQKGTIIASGRAVGSRIGSGCVRVIKDAHRPRRLQPRRGAGRGHDDAGLGAAHEDCRGDRHQPRRTHLPRRDRRARTRHPGGGRRRARDRGAAFGRSRSPCPAPRATPARVYEGALEFEVTETDLAAIPKPATHIMVNLGNPELAFQTSFLPNDGVGLARMEFIISEAIKVHPMALVHPDRVEDADERKEIERLTARLCAPGRLLRREALRGRRHDRGRVPAEAGDRAHVRFQDQRVRRSSSAAARSSRSEANPMLGFRGAARYAHPAYEAGFALECAAMQRVRETMGLKNLKIMIPFCRRLEEAETVLEVMAKHGLERGQDGLEVYVMCEIPNNVILIDRFAELFDGFSIGSNDLTQLMLGVDRDSEMVAFDFDERDPGVLELLKLAVEGAKRNHRHSGICGQAPSDFPEIAEYLVRLGIDSISLTPDTVIKTTLAVLDLEKKLGRAPRPQMLAQTAA